MQPFLLAAAIALVPHPAKGELTVARVFGSEFSTQGSSLHGTWLPDGHHLVTEKASEIVRVDAVTGKSEVLVPASKLTPSGTKKPLPIEEFALSSDGKRLLIFTNSRKVWRQNTRGDYWVVDIPSGKLTKLGGDAAESTLMFAKLSPDGRRAGFVCKNNLYVEDLDTEKITPLTTDGNDTTINGTVDWVYEEELGIRDGWRWSPDGKSIAYWQLDTRREPTYTLLNYTDSRYPTPLRFPYPKTGETNADARIGVVSMEGGETTWTDVKADSDSGYLSRMDWAGNSGELLIQKQNRLQNQTDFRLANAKTGVSRSIFVDSDPAFVELLANDTDPNGVRWTEGSREFLVLSERDGWRHLYAVARDGASRLLTPGSFDVEGVAGVDEKNGIVYFNASPTAPTARFLYRANLSGQPDPQRVTPAGVGGTNGYDVSPTGDLAIHSHSQFGVPPDHELVQLPSHRQVRGTGDNEALKAKLRSVNLGPTKMVVLKTADGQPMDATLILPPNFDPRHRYPLFFNIYGEPWGATATDSWGAESYLFHQMLAQRGYIVASVDNRGTPSPKGRAWRKVIYKKIGVIASDDQAAAARQLSRLSYVDGSRIGVWGWSGGGSMTLNLMFRHPELYRLGMAVAPVPDVHLYDTIYQERYMGLPSDNASAYDQSSPITFAKNLRGSLLIVHGSGDDNVHYQGTERLVNKLVELDKPFQLMVYPNRTHAISEGPGTTRHLYELLERFLVTNMPPR
ncbi:S9 family peptidase [Fimbriimonas ginsengisoli]|uniref:Dipeptidyl peptidase IV n=1 Tax=Fimbriimonas ginsengisoli Gsoil 348 TaxID=661478 RepID=A0A068NP21_FIMGI|nr:S9 family peptidase [Fimbriimonas ginsengisoli]AIE85112.1 Dipeptidyl peptidase IV [Fimbriimonas ginsengisoli Gsoil 348]